MKNQKAKKKKITLQTIKRSTAPKTINHKNWDYPPNQSPAWVLFFFEKATKN
jgi:hypothetical protein